MKGLEAPLDCRVLGWDLGPMSRRKGQPAPFEGESNALSGAKTVLAEKYRRAINGLWDYTQRGYEPTVIQVGAGFYQPDAEWMEQAVCAGIGVKGEVFYPETDEDKIAKGWQDYCEVCPVMMQCREFGEKNKLVGVWGNVYRPGRHSSGKVRGRPPVTGERSSRDKASLEVIMRDRAA